MESETQTRNTGTLVDGEPEQEPGKTKLTIEEETLSLSRHNRGAMEYLPCMEKALDPPRFETLCRALCEAIQMQ